MIDHIDGWHFAGTTLRDGTPLPGVGVELPPVDDPASSICGYRLCKRAFDSLLHARGPMVAMVSGYCCVDVDDTVYACRRMVVVAGYIDATDALRKLTATWLRRAVAVGMAKWLREILLADEASELEAVREFDWNDLDARDAIDNAICRAGQAAMDARRGMDGGRAAAAFNLWIAGRRIREVLFRDRNCGWNMDAARHIAHITSWWGLCHHRDQDAELVAAITPLFK